MAEFETTMNVTCPKCEHDFVAEGTVDIEPVRMGD